MERLLAGPPWGRGPFLAAMREALALHMRRSEVFRGVCRMQGFEPRMLRSEKDLGLVPFIMVNAFKERDLSIPGVRVALELTSSGTTGQKSRMLLDRTSLDRVQRLARQVFAGLGLVDPSQTADYLCFTYDPSKARNLGTAWTDKLLMGFTRAGEAFFAFQWDGAKGDFRFAREEAVEALERFEKRGRPVRILGFPAFALQLCEDFRAKRGRSAKLARGSRVITGGGWKDLQDKAMDKGLMRRRLADGLGIPAEHVRDLFGMVEHGVPYVDCGLGEFHIPDYSRVLVRDPATLAVLPAGKTGLLQFMTPYLSSYPSISLLTCDFGSVLPRCRCGLGGPILRIRGRAGVAKLKGCAVSASRLLA